MSRWLTVVVALFVGVAAACGSSSKSSSGSSATTTIAHPSTSVQGAHSSTTVKGNAKPRPVELKVARNTKLKEKIIVNAGGRTVYVYVPDGTSTTSKVPKALHSAWPPVTTTAKSPKVGVGLSPSKLKVEVQPGGKKQVSYNGHLLYLFSGDRSRGTANGQGLGKVWYVLSPSGTLVR